MQSGEQIFMATGPGSTRERRAGVFGLLIAAWLCLGLQPCAIAAEAHEDCPHCPPEHGDGAHAAHERHAEHGEGSHAAHDRHAGHAGSGSAAHETHAGMAKASPCSAMQVDCCDASAAAVDTRSGERKADQDDRPAAALPVPNDHFAVAFSPRTERVADPPPIVVASRPLHKLHCVYRD